ncbi:hypothetical protein IAT38_006595 [Cryptococcus sp. DSM 104549]
MPLILASLVFAIALAALPSTEPPDEAEYAQYMEYLRWRHGKSATRHESLSHKIEGGGGEIKPFDRAQGRRIRRSKSELLSLGSVGDFNERFTLPLISPSYDTLPREQDSLLPPLSIPSSRAASPSHYYGGTHLRRSSSVPSLSSSATSSPESSAPSSPRPFVGADRWKPKCQKRGLMRCERIEKGRGGKIGSIDAQNVRKYPSCLACIH